MSIGFAKDKRYMGISSLIKTGNIINKDFAYYNVESKKWSVEEGKYKILIGKSSVDIVLEKEIYIKSEDELINKEYSNAYKTGDIQKLTDEDFEKLLGYNIPKRYITLSEISEENTLEQIKNTKIGKVIYENQIEKMNKLLNEQNVNRATKVMMDLQKPLKKFYEKKSSKYTKEMIDELVHIAKNDLDYDKCDFLQEYLK